jgi:hypothetical protein
MLKSPRSFIRTNENATVLFRRLDHQSALFSQGENRINFLNIHAESPRSFIRTKENATVLFRRLNHHAVSTSV